MKNPSFTKQMESGKGKKNDDHHQMNDNKIISKIFELLGNLITPQLLFLVGLSACSVWSQQLSGIVLASLKRNS